MKETGLKKGNVWRRVEIVQVNVKERKKRWKEEISMEEVEGRE